MVEADGPPAALEIYGPSRSDLAAVFLLAPLVAICEVWRAVTYKANAAVYFAALGLGFMFFEVSLIQRLTLFCR